MEAGRLVGTVTAVQRFPVKSMAVDPVQGIRLLGRGLEGDRQFAFLKSNNHTRFPWLTARDVPSLILYRAAFLDPTDLRRSKVGVLSPDGTDYDLEDPLLASELAELAGEPVQLLEMGRGAFDDAPVSVITTSTMAHLAASHGGAIDVARFRANIVIEPTDAKIRERDWLGGMLTFGDDPAPARLRADTPIARCAMITLDPGTARKDVSIMRTVARKFANQIGVYGEPQAPGMIRPGMPVYWR